MLLCKRYNDSHLPSINDLELMYITIGQGADNIGNFEDGTYWSSTEYPNETCYLNLANGNMNHLNRILSRWV